MPDIKPIAQNILPQLADKNVSARPTAAPSDIVHSEKTENRITHEAPKKQSNFIFQKLQLAGLLVSLPLIVPSLLIQAENITKFGEKGFDGSIKFISSIIDVLSSPFRFAVNRFFKNDNNRNDVSANKRSFIYDDFFQRILHPMFVRELASTLFGVRRALFNFFPKVFITPSEERDPNNKNIKKTSSGLANLFFAGSSFVGPIRWISSLITFFSSIPSYITGTISSYNGDQKIFELSKYFSKINDLFTPITSNLSSLFSSSRAIYDSSKGESLKVTFGRYNINILNVFQGIMGGILSIPSFFGAISVAKNLILEKNNQSNNYKFSEYSGEIVAYLLSKIQRSGLLTNWSQANVKTTVGNFFNNIIVSSGEHLSHLIDSFYNSSFITKKIASLFRPIDGNGNIINRNQLTLQLETDRGLNVTKTGFSKKLFFNEIHSLLHPIQSLIMLLPAAYTPISDSYINDNGKLSLRLLDRIFGISSFILSAPNYLIYALSTRVPQVILKYFELKQKSANTQGREYNAYAELNKLKSKLLNSGMPGSAYLIQVLDELPIDRFTFYSNETTTKILDQLERQAQDQEPSNKGTEIIETFRIGAKALLATKNPLFFAERDDLGYTAEEHNRLKVYQSLGTFKEGIGRIPIIGLFISPFIEILRSRYYVKPKKSLASKMPGLE